MGPPRQCCVTENSCLDSGEGARQTCVFTHSTYKRIQSDARIRVLATDRDLESGCDSTQSYREKNSSDCFGSVFVLTDLETHIWTAFKRQVFEVMKPVSAVKVRAWTSVLATDRDPQSFFE